MTGRRVRLAGGVILLVVGGLLSAASAVRAQDAGEVTAFTLGSRAFAVRVLYDTPGSLPIGPLVELTAPESRATLSTGDEGSAFSAVGYPGPVLAGLPQIAATAGVDLSFLPAYPFAVTATSSGPTEIHDSVSVPGSSMDAVVTGGKAQAITRTPAIGLPGVLDIGTLRSTAEAVHDGTVTASSSTEAGGINLLGGLIKIDAIRSQASATSDGGTPTATASTNLIEGSFLGSPIRIGLDGIELMPGTTILQGVVNAILQPLGGPDGILAASGLRIRAGAVRTDITADKAVVGAEGLTLEVNGAVKIGLIDDLMALLPPIPAIPGVPVGPTDAIGLIQAYQVRTVNVGQATVDLTARGPAAEEPLPDSDGAVTQDPSFGFPDVPSFDSPSLPPSSGPVSRPTGGGALPLPPLPASGALVAIGGALVASVGFRRFADLALDPVVAPTACALIPDLEATDD
jgi:hypothetical protein